MITMLLILMAARIAQKNNYTSEEIIVEHDAQDGGNANYIGNDGDIVNGLPESDTEETDENP